MKPLLYNQSPFPLSRGRGIKGDGVAEGNLKGGEVDKQSQYTPLTNRLGMVNNKLAV